MAVDRSRRPIINSAQLIKLVEQHSCLYDNRGVHGNHELKNAAWGEIARTMFEEEWPDFSLLEKDTLVKDLQVRWKNLRDNFSRQLRITEQAKLGIGTFPKRKYIFMDALEFLTPYTNKRERILLPTEESKDDNDSMYEDERPLKELVKTESNDTTTTSTVETRFIQIKPKPTSTITFNPCDINTFTMMNSKPSEPQSKTVAQCLSELIAIQREDRVEDAMGNKRFLLSLLPFMKKLPDDVNLEVRLQLMSVLQTYSGGKDLQK